MPEPTTGNLVKVIDGAFTGMIGFFVGSRWRVGAASCWRWGNHPCES